MKIRHIAFLVPFGAALFSGCAINTAGPDAGIGAADPADAKIVVGVEDETDKAYLSDAGDPSSLYREIATELAAALSGSGIPSSVYDAPGARRLTVHLRRVALTNNSSGSNLDIRLRTECAAELGDWSQSYRDETIVQRSIPGGSSPPVIRELIAAQVTGEMSGDPDLLRAAGK